MITSILKCRLGNQMFQIAAVHALALDNSDECAFDLTTKDFHRGKGPRTYIDNVFRNIKELSASWVSEYVYIEPKWSYSPIPYHKNMVIDAFSQSEKYFINHKKEIIDLFKDRNKIHDIEIEFLNYLKDSVSLHVRREDYLWSPVLFSLPTDYYKKALTFIENKTKIDHILVFSDDIPWCKENFKDPRILFVEGRKDYEDMYLMSLCDHHIIVNSSFSWWGSYLNENEDKIVCAPNPWFGETISDFQDIYYDKMNIIS